MELGGAFLGAESASGQLDPDLARMPSTQTSVAIVERLPAYRRGLAAAFARLTPRSQRKSAQEIMQDLRVKLAAVPGINAFPQLLPPIRIGGQLTKSQYQFTLQSPETNELYQDAPKLEAKLHNDPQFQKLLRFICENGFEHHVAINPTRVAFGLKEALSTYLGWEVYHHGA